MPGHEEIFEKALNVGHTAIGEQKWSKAVAAYRKALQEIPDHPKALNSLGLALFQEGNYDEALLVYKHAVQITPNDPVPMEKLAQLLERTGHLKEAIDAAIRAADLFLNQRDVEKSIENWVHVITLDPEHILAHSRLALAYERLGHKEQAVIEYIAVASLLQRAENTQKARELVNKALKLVPESHVVQEALILLRQGQLLPKPLQPKEYEAYRKILAAKNSIMPRAKRKRLQSKLFDEILQEDSKVEVIFSENEQLTPRLLSFQISPYLIAIEQIQHIIDEIEGRQPREVKIKVIVQNSPISVSLDGVADAAGLIRDSIIPWRRKHHETMARLIEQEKLMDIENKKAEILEKRAQTAKEREETRKLQLENEGLRLQVQREKVKLAIDVLQQLGPNLSETEKAAYLIRLVSPLETIITNQSAVSFSKSAG